VALALVDFLFVDAEEYRLVHPIFIDFGEDINIPSVV
jgi:hypothetical protein